MSYDRDEVLDRTDLRALFVELVGPGRGPDQRAMYPCPSPTHAQTGRTPPVSINAANRLWNCHGCPAGGTAVDLLMITQGLGVGEALAELANRAGVRPDEPAWSPPPRDRLAAPPPKPADPPRPAAPGALDELRAFVDAAARLLWEPQGEPIRRWLHDRGLGDDVLRANRVGADPGVRVLPRADGLPKGGPGAVFPVLDAAGDVVYYQLRYLHPRGAKYNNPKEDRFGPIARLAIVGTSAAAGGPVIVCEGMPDAFVVAQAGYRAAAVLGVGLPNAAVAQALVTAFPDAELLVGFDRDQSGEAGAAELGRLLAAAAAGRRVRRLMVPDAVADDPKERDLNTWAVVAGSAFAAQLRDAFALAEPLGWEAVPSAADLLAAFYAVQDDQAGALAIPTGLPDLDQLLAHGGWRPGLVLFGGLAGAGKTAFALAAAVHAGLAGHPVVYVSVEQSPMEMLGRLFCRELAMPIAAYWNRTPAYVAGAREVAHRLPLAQLYFRSDPFLIPDVEGTVGRVRRWATAVANLTGKTPFVIVDYLQRMRPGEADRHLDDHRQISMAGLGLRQLARDLGCPVVAISSIGRASYDRAPSLAAFKGSGDLEYDADAAFLLRVAATSEEEAAAMLARGGAQIAVELHAVKNRYGPETGPRPVLLTFDRAYGSFRQVTPSPPPAAAPGNGSGPHPPPLQLGV